MMLNYRRSRFEQLTGISSSAVVPQALRRPLLTAAAIGTVIALVHIGECQRIARADNEAALVQRQLDGQHGSLIALDLRDRARNARRARASALRELHSDNTREINRFARIGNTIPSHVALIGITTEGQRTTIQGRCTDFPALSATMDVLGNPRLLSVREDATHHGLLFTLQIEEHV